jgi:Tfp pilus assembly protein PilV
MAQFTTHSRKRQASVRGTTLVEAAIAIAIIAVGLAGAVTMNSVTLKVGRASSDVAQAQQCIRSILEMVRNNTWQGVTNSNYLQNTVLASGNVARPLLQQATILLEVSPYPLTGANSAETISATINPNGSVTSLVGSSSANLPNESAAKVRVNITWVGNRSRTQEAITIISRGGILGVNH